MYVLCVMGVCVVCDGCMWCVMGVRVMCCVCDGLRFSMTVISVQQILMGRPPFSAWLNCSHSCSPVLSGDK